MNRRKSKVLRTGSSATVVLPKDWCRGENVGIGDEVEVLYDGEIRIRPLRPEGASAESPKGG
jgi:antitoxin component of MazEF toxin-antitoxin module